MLDTLAEFENVIMDWCVNRAHGLPGLIPATIFVFRGSPFRIQERCHCLDWAILVGTRSCRTAKRHDRANFGLRGACFRRTGTLQIVLHSIHTSSVPTPNLSRHRCHQVRYPRNTLIKVLNPIVFNIIHEECNSILVSSGLKSHPT
jgi:hypothetical protein